MTIIPCSEIECDNEINGLVVHIFNMDSVLVQVVGRSSQCYLIGRADFRFLEFFMVHSAIYRSPHSRRQDRVVLFGL